MTSLRRTAACAAVLLACSACAAIPSQRASFRNPTDVARLSRSAEGIAGIEIQAGVAEVRVVGGIADSIVVGVAMRSQDRERLTDICIPRSELIAEPDERRLVVRLAQRSRDQCGEVWEVAVPAGMPVTVHAEVGKIFAEGLAGGFAARITGTGSIDATLAGGPVDARVAVGDVRVDSREASYRSVRISTNVGRVHVEAAGMRLSPPRHGAGARFESNGDGRHDARLRSDVGDVTFIVARAPRER